LNLPAGVTEGTRSGKPANVKGCRDGVRRGPFRQAQVSPPAA